MSCISGSETCSEATKQRLLQLPTPGVLHLATHGLFLEDAPVPRGSSAVVSFGVLGEEAPATPSPDPLLRSGLILAGARPTGPETSGAARPPLDTALVTALELAGLNPWGPQLVVLSARDTGRGDVRLGQGVFGLRRARPIPTTGPPSFPRLEAHAGALTGEVPDSPRVSRAETRTMNQACPAP